MEANQLAVLVVSKFIKNFVPGSSTNFDSVKITRVSSPESRYPWDLLKIKNSAPESKDTMLTEAKGFGVNAQKQTHLHVIPFS